MGYPSISPTPDPNPEVYNFEGLIEQACKDCFDEQWFPLYQSAKQRDSATLITPRAEFHLTVGQQEQRDFLIQGTQDPTNDNRPWAYPYIWHGSIKSLVVTNRLDDADENSTNHLAHKLVRGWLRRTFICHNRISSKLTYHQIVRAWETGSNTSFIETQGTAGHDLTEMNHGLIFCIQPSQLPQPS